MERDVDYEVTTLTRAHYRGVEGELPFEYWDKARNAVRRLADADARFATLDYSERRSRCYFSGEMVEFDELKLKNLRSSRDGNR